MKLTAIKRTLGKGEKKFTVCETVAYNTPIRFSRKLVDLLKTLKPQINGTEAEYDLDENTAQKLILTATVKNGYTTIYLTLKEEKEEKVVDNDLPF